MKSPFYFFTLIIILLFTACKKEFVEDLPTIITANDSFSIEVVVERTHDEHPGFNGYDNSVHYKIFCYNHGNPIDAGDLRLTLQPSDSKFLTYDAQLEGYQLFETSNTSINWPSFIDLAFFGNSKFPPYYYTHNTIFPELGNIRSGTLAQSSRNYTFMAFSNNYADSTHFQIATAVISKAGSHSYATFPSSTLQTIRSSSAQEAKITSVSREQLVADEVDFKCTKRDIQKVEILVY